MSQSADDDMHVQGKLRLTNMIINVCHIVNSLVALVLISSFTFILMLCYKSVMFSFKSLVDVFV